MTEISNIETKSLPVPFELTAPEPPAPVPVQAADAYVKLKQDEQGELDKQVSEFVVSITQNDAQSQVFRECVAKMHSMGNADIQQSAQVSNRLLDKPVKTMNQGIFESGSNVSQSLVNLRKTVESLDPSKQGDLFVPRKLLGLIPFGNRVTAYFDQYLSAQEHINAIIDALMRGKDELLRDNAAIEQDKVNLWTLMQRIQKYIYLGKRLDSELENRVAELALQDQEKARVVREEMLFYTRQKVTDLLTQMAVNVQGYLALDMLRKNNLELIKGVDRAVTTTVSALRTAVIVAQALNNQKLVLDQITALNTTTGNMIEATSVMLKQQTAQIHEQAVSSTVDLEKLKSAFSNIYQTLDAIGSFKTQALPAMQKTVEVLSAEVDKAQSYLGKVRQQESSPVAANVSL